VGWKNFPLHNYLSQAAAFAQLDRLEEARIADRRGSPEAVRSSAGFHNFEFKDFSIADAQILELVEKLSKRYSVSPLGKLNIVIEIQSVNYC
jgi:arginyl-tRNA synthetase